MRFDSVAVPAAILLDRELTASAKLIWIYSRFEADISAAQPPDLARMLTKGNSGLTLPTIRRALSELATRDLLRNGLAPELTTWNEPRSGHVSGFASRDSRRTASLPAELLVDPDLGTYDKLVYGFLQLVPGFSDSKGQFVYADLGALSGISVSALKPAIWTLWEAGWLRAARASRRKPIDFALRNPVAEGCEGMIAGIDERLKEVEPHGEALMKAYLSLIIDSDKYQDNARPAFLRNPFSGEIMELDRLYHEPDVAWEFNGLQHSRPTAKYPSKTKYEKQRARDCIKAGICAAEGIKLIVVHAQDLTFATMRKKVGTLLPLRNLSGLERVIDHLEDNSWTYRLTAGNS